MTKQFLRLVLAGGLGLAATAARAQTPVALPTSSPYTENFNALGTALPTGFGVYVSATASSLGTAGTYATAPAPWNNTGGGFKNFASAGDASLTAASSTADQAAATNRALGVRQTGTAGAGYDPGAAFVFQAANTTGKTDFVLTFKLQSLDNTTAPRVVTWQVEYGLGSAPTTFTVLPAASVTGTLTTGNNVFSNNTVTANFGTALDNQSGPVTIRISALASSGSGNRPSSAIDDFSLSWSAPTSTTPTLAVSSTALTFASQNVGTTSAAQTYSLSGTNLTAATAVAVTGPFTISKDNTTYGTSLSYSAADLATAQTVYVKFTPTAGGPATGSISHTNSGVSTARTVALSGSGTDPNQTVFSFNACNGTTSAVADGWTQYSVTGAQTWGCTTYGRDPNAPTGTTAAPYGVQMNGYSSGNVENEDWFISPAFTLTSYNFPIFQFWSRTAFTGPALKLRVSTNYSGTGNPNAAGVTWTELPVQFPAGGSDTWTQSPAINLSAYKQAGVYVAFVYTSTTSGAARWTLDDISVTNSATAPAPVVFADATRLSFGYQAVSTNGTRTLTVGGTDLTADLTLTSSSPAFTLSANGTTFAQTLTLPRADVNGQSKAVTVRFSPTTAATSYSGTITVASTGAASSRTVAVSGDTYDLTKTLEVVNYNIEWFGSTTSGQGPTDKNLQQTNITTMLTGLAADVYMLEEVVDTARLRTVVNQLSTNTGKTYGLKVSTFGSYADNTADPDYAGAQKLAFVYRKDVVTPTQFAGLLYCTEAQNCAAWKPWASGRFPYLMKANVTLDGVTRSVNFIVIHAKANSTTTSADDYNRRKVGAELLKALLDAAPYAGQNTLIAGDYNDVLNGTIATGVTPAVSSYKAFVDDANYNALTLPLANVGAASTASYPTLIDNVIATKQMGGYYLAGTAAVRTDLASAISNYANTTSDHYPIYTRYSLSQVLAARSAATAQLGLYPNPVTNTVRVEVPETGRLALEVVGLDGRLVLSGNGSLEQLNQQLNQRVAGLAAGLYLVRVIGAQQTYVARFQKQ